MYVLFFFFLMKLLDLALCAMTLSDGSLRSIREGNAITCLDKRLMAKFITGSVKWMMEWLLIIFFKLVVVDE